MRLSKAKRLALAAWLHSIYEKSQQYADELDPKRRHKSDVANHIDGITVKARDAYFHLTGKHITYHK